MQVFVHALYTLWMLTFRVVLMYRGTPTDNSHRMDNFFYFLLRWDPPLSELSVEGFVNRHPIHVEQLTFHSLSSCLILIIFKIQFYLSSFQLHIFH